MKKNNGITLISVVVTILILIIISTVTMTVGKESYNFIKTENYINKLKIIQGKVDNITEEGSNFDYSQFTTLSSISGTDDYTLFSNIISNPANYNIDTSKSWDNTYDGDVANYYYFTEKDLEKIGLKNQDMIVIINFKTRNIISQTPVKSKGKKYYRQYDILGGEHLVN